MRCEEPQLYLRYDLTLDDLSEAVGVGKGMLSQWFAEHYSHLPDGRLQGKSFNVYINSLRIDHFINFYSEAGRDDSSKSIYDLATLCGYRNYTSFSSAFRQRMGCNVAEWLNSHKQNNQTI